MHDPTPGANKRMLPRSSNTQRTKSTMPLQKMDPIKHVAPFTARNSDLSPYHVIRSLMMALAVAKCRRMGMLPATAAPAQDMWEAST